VKVLQIVTSDKFGVSTVAVAPWGWHLITQATDSIGMRAFRNAQASARVRAVSLRLRRIALARPDRTPER
jgi:hypothetical protein